MNRLLNTTIAATILLWGACGTTRAQHNTNNPYSMFGIGELRPQTNAVNAGMGNSGFALPSGSTLNLLNPASFAGIDTLNVLFDIGVDGKYADFHSTGQRNQAFTGNFSYLALGFRVTKWMAAGLGVNPFSHTGYEINSSSSVEGVYGSYPLDIVGSGNISRAYINLAVSPVKNLALGFKPSFLFGAMEQSQTHRLNQFTGNDDFLTAGDIVNTTKDYFYNFFFEFGFQYTLKLKPGTFSAGAIYIPSMALVTDRTNTAYETSWGTVENKYKKDFIIPEEIGAGLAFRNQRWRAALDGGLQKWSDFNYYKLAGIRLQNNPYIRSGVEFTPTFDAYAPLYRRMSYRLGMQYEKSYLLLHNTDQYEYCLSLGVGLPLRYLADNFRMRSFQASPRLDIALEFGRNGATVNRLIQEDFIRLRLGFAMRDFWFLHRVYD
ncbi:MAG: hypothetical protein LBR06_08055 [Bacteroidales bacterium]|jgi:hypothetical protein|nr:hypothetical protein [Bacteroidales bacterium]